MAVNKKQSVRGIVISWAVGLIILLVVIAALQYFSVLFSSAMLHTIAVFLLDNLGIVVLFGIIFLIGDIFMTLPLPLSLPGPVFTAAGCVIVLEFVFDMVAVIAQMYGMGSVFPLESVKIMLFILIFVLVLAAGYISLFAHSCRRCGAGSESAPDGETPGEQGRDDIGDEIQQLICDIVRRLRDAVNGR
jgi:hypothetical protein